MILTAVLDSAGVTAVNNPPHTCIRHASHSRWRRPRTCFAGSRSASKSDVNALGINCDTIATMAMTLRLTDDEADALRRRADREGRSMQDVARQAVREYVETHSRAELLDQVLDAELPRYAEALERLGQ